VALVGPAPAPAAAVTVDADPVRLQQILGNLVSNAVRHTPSGGTVTITLERPEPGRVGFTVADTGPGFPAEALPGLFDRFTKSEGSAGSGLGLAIARDLVLAHGGTIEAANQPGGGAVVSFRLPTGSDGDR
jgi:two-component system sensor histidine kinase BaeS